MSILRSILPDVVPDEEILVEEEPHLFRETEYDDGTTQSQEKYILDKAPVKTVEEVYGKVNGSQEDFTAGQDYKLLDDKTTIDFSIGGNSPDGNTEFYVTYRCRSIIDRYIESHEEVLEEVDEKRDKAIAANFVEQADGQELDEIGRLFGVVGKRNGRDDERYRIYLKSIAKSFISRGTISGIKEAISIATEVPVEDITIEEDFENNKYRVDVIPNTPVTGSLLEEVADIADPSGVEQSGTTFTLDADEVSIDDIVEITKGGTETFDTLGIADSTASPRVQFFDVAVVEDVLSIDPNNIATSDDLFTSDSVTVPPTDAVTSDITGSDDSFAINPRTTSVSDTLYIDSFVSIPRRSVDEEVETKESLNVEPSHKNAHRWEDDNSSDTTGWNFFEWTELRDLDRETADAIATSDIIVIPNKAATTSDTVTSVDTARAVFNTESVGDTAYTDDAANVPPSDAETTDTGGLSDSQSVSSTNVAWNTNSWGAFDWTVQHN